MHDALPQQAGQTSAPAATAAEARAAAAAEEAQLDARIELAAKKAALAGLEAQVGPVVAGAPPSPPGMPSGRIVIERDGKTIILENPTAEQIAAAGGVGTQMPAPEGWVLVAMSGMTFAAIIIVTTLILKYFRSRQKPQFAASEAQAEARMARIENAIESIAVEVERISEGQRYTSKMLADGAAVPVAVGDRNEAVVPTRRET